MKLSHSSEVDEVFKTLRAWSFAASYGELVLHHRDQIKDTVIWNTEEGQKLSAAQVARAETLRTTLYHRVRLFMQKHPFLILPVSQVPPFDINQPYTPEGLPVGVQIVGRPNPMMTWEFCNWPMPLRGPRRCGSGIQSWGKTQVESR